MTRLHVLLLVAVALAACSDDDEGGPRDTGVDKAVAVEAAVPDSAVPDSAAPDADPYACDSASLGKPCTPGGSAACGNNGVCLATTTSAGFCSCPCTRDDLGTKLQDEDTCPEDHACGVQGGADRCLALVANTKQVPSCGSVTMIMADATDPPFLLAARLTPKSYPFTVSGVRYFLSGSAQQGCDNGLAHDVVVFVGTQTTPPASPTVSETIKVPAKAGDKGTRMVNLALTTPLTLKSGEHLFVAPLVTYDTSASGSICLQLCSESATGDASFTNDTGATVPYTWTSFKTKQWSGDLLTAALGFSG
jgi:hypothetical protein